MKTRKEEVVELDVARRAKALQSWADDCRKRIGLRWAGIDFDSDHWPVNSRYKTKIQDVSFSPAFADFKGKDSAYEMALRCLMAEIALKGGIKDAVRKMSGWRLLSQVDVPLHELRRVHLTELERTLVQQAKDSPSRAGSLYGELLELHAHINLTGALGVTDRMAWNPAPQTRHLLLSLAKHARQQFKAINASVLDRKIEALSDAQSAMFRGDDRLSAFDRVALAVMGLTMCCPNRVNEPLCMSTDDRFTLNDYQMRSAKPGLDVDSQSLERVHQMLLVKGSKGASWGGKPILNFMIAFCDLCIDVIKQHGERSRALVAWYESHPDILYLPVELEHLRGTDIDMVGLWKIINLEGEMTDPGKVASLKPIMKELRQRSLIKKIPNPKTHKVDGTRNSRPTIQSVAWSDLEPILLARVKNSMEAVRRVTHNNSYQGCLSNMLMLFDSERVPYLPGSIKYGALSARLSQTERRNVSRSKYHKSDWKPEPTLFEKLGIKMVVNGAVTTAYIATHDPRRWLTTQALNSDLPDVLANKWANRLCIDQLKAYDFRSPERKAEQASMPDIKELSDMTQGLQSLGALEREYGLNTHIVALGEANISVTSMNDIMQATESRPVARTANQIIILYPQRYGVCLHQHHERPCRSYKCAPCNEGVVVKGHLPTNERIRKDADLLFRSVLSQLEALLIARQRQLGKV